MKLMELPNGTVLNPMWVMSAEEIEGNRRQKRTRVYLGLFAGLGMPDKYEDFDIPLRDFMYLFENCTR